MTDYPVILRAMARVSASQKPVLEAERRGQILDAAARLWAARGFDATSVDAVAREAGLAKGTIYLYFPTKESLLTAALQRHSLLPDLTRLSLALRERPLAEALPGLVDPLWQRLRAGAPLVAMLFRELSLRPVEARHFLESAMLPANRPLAELLDARVAAGELRPLDTFVAARGLVGMLVMFCWSQEVLGGRALRPIEDAVLVETVSEIFLRGVLAAPRPSRPARGPRGRTGARSPSPRPRRS